MWESLSWLSSWCRKTEPVSLVCQTKVNCSTVLLPPTCSICPKLTCKELFTVYKAGHNVPFIFILTGILQGQPWNNPPIVVLSSAQLPLEGKYMRPALYIVNNSLHVNFGHILQVGGSKTIEELTFVWHTRLTNHSLSTSAGQPTEWLPHCCLSFVGAVVSPSHEPDSPSSPALTLTLPLQLLWTTTLPV